MHHSEIKAVIDIGTYSIKFCLAKRSQNGFSIITDENCITRLGENFKNGLLNRSAIERTAFAVQKFADYAKNAGAEIRAVGTMALRSAKNADDFIKLVKELSGLNVEIITGQDEARLSFAAASSALNALNISNCMVFDCGGGSTEFIYGNNGNITKKFSINMGIVGITEKFNLSGKSDISMLAAASSEIYAILQNAGADPFDGVLIGVGGTVTSMVSVKLGLDVYSADLVHGTILTVEDVERQIYGYAKTNLGERSKIKGLNPNRADVLLAGACIVKQIMLTTEKNAVTVSDRGLRHAIMAEMMRLGEHDVF